jgi:crotonobetainyl-CoA:carnitine CoA-transferase CaiB-like acyl-CoA transferase
MFLEGIRVLDLSRILAGPLIGATMGDMGADVIKVERPGRGDDMRWLRGDSGLTASFATFNRNKRGIAVDMSKPEGSEVVLELARQSDVVIENFLPGVATRLGVGYDQIKAVKPDIVYASVTGFGQTGPYSSRGGYNSVALGMSGFMGLTGMPDNPPTRPGGSLADVAAANVALYAINAALVRKERKGEGAYLDVNLLASALALLPDPVANYYEIGIAPKRLGNRSPSVTPGEVYEASDGLITIVLTSPVQWKKLCVELGDTEMFDDPRYRTNADRLQNFDSFRARMDAHIATATCAEWVERLSRHAIAVGPVYEFPEVFDDPQIKHLDLVKTVDQPGLGDVKMLGPAFRSDSLPDAAPKGAPRLGEHTHEILRDILGMDAARIEQLEADKIVEQASDSMTS